MSETLSYKESITRIGYTEIDGKRVMQHVCTISRDNPQEMSVSFSRLDQSLYKDNREACLADFKEFEDLAYKLQEELVAELESQTGEESDEGSETE